MFSLSRANDSHALGVNSFWSIRHDRYAACGVRRQTLGSVGIYDTTLSHQGLGAADWRGLASN